MLRLIGFLVLGLAGASGVLFLDFNRVVKEANASEGEPPSFQAYLGSVPKKLASLTESSRLTSRVTDLPDMMPRAPEGWTMRPLAEGDIESFLPRSGTQANPAMIERVKAAADSTTEPGATVAVQAYERGERLVVVRLVRLPDAIFSDPAQADRLHDLQVAAAELSGRPFLTVRGLGVTEEFLGDGMRARYFSAHVGAQIQIRVLGSRRLKDADLLPFFETLNVKAMNASVIDRQPGLGEVPVLVLGSALNEADLAAYEADRAAQAARDIQRAQDLRDAARARLAAADPAEATAPAAEAQAPTAECRTGPGGTKQCKITGGADG